MGSGRDSGTVAACGIMNVNERDRGVVYALWVHVVVQPPVSVS